jgi:hypothetical protein
MDCISGESKNPSYGEVPGSDKAMETLREKLAIRLSWLRSPGVPRNELWSIYSPSEKRIWRRIASECIRQMERVRSEQYESWSGACQADHEPCCWRNVDLTIAPENWKP